MARIKVFDPVTKKWIYADEAFVKVPVKGVDYYTDADKADMVAQVKAALTSETWTFTLEDGTTVTKKVAIL